MMTDDSKDLEDIAKWAEEIKKNTKPISTEYYEKTIKEFEEIIKSIDTDTPSTSVEKHKSNIKKLGLSYDDLLYRAAIISELCELKAFENKRLKLRLDAYDKLVSAKQDLDSQYDNATDTAIEFMRLDKLANNTIASSEGQIKGRDAGLAAQKKAITKKSVAGRQEKDPKQKEKASVKKHWEAWQKGLSKYKTQTDFTRKMVKKHKHLCNTEVIARWCRGWKKIALLNR